MAPSASGLRIRTSATSLATKLPAAVVAISLISLLAAIILAARSGRDLSQELTDEQLIALQGSARFDVAAELGSMARTAEALASSSQAVEAVEVFGAGLDELDRIALTDLTEEARAVVTHHQEAYIEPLQAAGRKIDLRDISTAGTASIYVQYNYAVDLGVFDAPESIDDSADGSAWSAAHAQLHPSYREVVERLQLTDLYLVEPEASRIVYTVRKRPDIGTSLTAGPFSGSILAQVAQSVRDDPSKSVVIGDLSFYDPTLLTPVGVVASPILDGDSLAGILVLMFDTSRLTAALTGNTGWDDAGFPESGQSYLIGRDGFTRSEVRSYVEDPRAHVASALAAGLIDETDVAAIEASNSTVLLQRADDETVLAARSGDLSVEERTNVIGVDTFSSAAAVPVDGLEWFVVSEVDVAAADGDLADFEELLIVGTAVFVAALAFFAVAWAARLVMPVRTISERLAARTNTGSIEVPSQSPLEFHRLATSFDSMTAALVEQSQQLASAREARLDVLRDVLPPGVAGRLADGELDALDEIPMATVVVLVLSLARADDSAEADQARLQSLLEELDELADQHDVERVKVIGDAYFAACGHDRPLIDHAPRAAAFASAASRIAADLGVTGGDGIDIAAGVHTGPVTVGTAGGPSLKYDVWGETVATAHLLARQAQAGQILASSAAKALLPASLTTTSLSADGVECWLIEAETTEPAQ